MNDSVKKLWQPECLTVLLDNHFHPDSLKQIWSDTLLNVFLAIAVDNLANAQELTKVGWAYLGPMYGICIYNANTYLLALCTSLPCLHTHTHTTWVSHIVYTECVILSLCTDNFISFIRLSVRDLTDVCPAITQGNEAFSPLWDLQRYMKMAPSVGSEGSWDITILIWLC